MGGGEGGGVPPSRQKAVIGVFEPFPNGIIGNEKKRRLYTFDNLKTSAKKVDSPSHNQHWTLESPPKFSVWTQYASEEPSFPQKCWHSPVLTPRSCLEYTWQYKELNMDDISMQTCSNICMVPELSELHERLKWFGVKLSEMPNVIAFLIKAHASNKKSSCQT